MKNVEFLIFSQDYIKKENENKKLWGLNFSFFCRREICNTFRFKHFFIQKSPIRFFIFKIFM